MCNVALDQSPGTVIVVPSTVHSAYLPNLVAPESVSITTRVPLGVVTSDNQLTLENVVKLVVAL